MNVPIDDRRLRYLYEALASGSVRAAADKLNMNPSVVSRQIAQLEADMAVPLMERLGRGVRPTDAGEVLIDYYRQHRAHQDDVVTKIREMRGLERGHITLVLGEGFVSDLMGKPIQDFWKQYPGLTITMNLAGTNDVIRQVTEDIAHIGLVYNPSPSTAIRSRAAVCQPLCAIVQPDHPLASMSTQPRLKDIAQYPLALMHSSYGTRQLIALAEQMDQLQLMPKLMTDSISIVKHFVRSRLGISLLPEFSVAQEIESGELVAVTIDQQILASAQAHIITRLGRQMPIAANQLLLQLMSAMRAFH
jgi:DNA-binding transcriptional LysR family regulator